MEPSISEKVQAQGSKLESHAAAFENRNVISDGVNIASSPASITSSTLGEGTLQDEGVNTPLFPHSILNTPAPRMRETSTPVRYFSSALPTGFSSDHDFSPHVRNTLQQSPSHRIPSGRPTRFPRFAAEPLEPMMQMLRDIRSTQLATIKQQHEYTRHIRALNNWLEQDLLDRQTEIRPIVEDFHQLRDDVRRSGPSFIYPGPQPSIRAPDAQLTRP